MSEFESFNLALTFHSALEEYNKIKDLIVEVRCPRCGVKIKARKGSPFYCYKCGIVFVRGGV